MATTAGVTRLAGFHCLAALGSLAVIGTGITGWLVYGVIGLNVAVVALWVVLVYYCRTGGTRT